MYVFLLPNRIITVKDYKFDFIIGQSYSYNPNIELVGVFTLSEIIKEIYHLIKKNMRNIE